MQAIYPYRWAGQFDSAEALVVAKGEWESVLENLDEKKIVRGLEKCKKQGSEFPPSIPTFFKMCFLDAIDVDIISEPEAFSDYANRDYRNHLVQIIRSLIDRFTFDKSTIENAQRTFSKAYKQAVNIYLRQLNEESEETN